MKKIKKYLQKIKNFLQQGQKSFTLIEILVVVAIIGILTAALFLAVISPAKAKARDARRYIDLTQIQKALEVYYTDNDKYPLSTSTFEIQGAPWGSPWQPYLSTVPNDPSSPNKTYSYYSEDGLSFQLYADFEREESMNSTFVCGSCGPDGEYNGGIASEGILFSVDSGEGDSGGEEEEPIVLAQGKQTYRIQQAHHSPTFTEAIIDPLDVKVGDKQTMTVSITDTYSITSVKAFVETDTGTKTYDLELKSGTDTNGTWENSWTVYDTHSAKYKTTFTAIDSNNESSSITLTWSDPCSPGAGGDWTLDGNCSASGTTGVDNGNLVIDGGYTLTLQAGATFVFNSGKSVMFTNGTIAKGTGAQVKKTNLWMTDADLDKYPASTTQVAQDLAPANGQRRYLMNTISSTDTNDSDPCADNTTTHQCGQDGGGGTCSPKTPANEYGLAACKRCNGSSIDPVNVTDDTQDAEGSNVCNSTCKKCSSGSCVDQTNAQDLFGHCSDAQCYTGNCDGSGACGLQTSSTDTYGYCGTTNCSTGNCIGGSNACGYYTSGQHSCSTCQYCDGSGDCTNATTNWGANLYSCSASNKRCYIGSCKTCTQTMGTNTYTGVLAIDGCSGCASQGGYVCWRSGTGNCDTVCTSYGGCVAANWNDDSSCTVLNSVARGGCETCDVDIYDSRPGLFVGEYSVKNCHSRTAGYSQVCSKSVTGFYRMCACKY